VQSALLNRWLGHNIWFKLENMQKVGAFKARGAMNTLLRLREEGNLPKHVVAFSSGNHAQAVAWACQQFNIKATIFIPVSASMVKRQAT
jgi:threonine dehydratase